MRDASAQLIAILNGNNTYMMADLYTVTLYGGQVFRWTGADTDITVGAYTFSAEGPLIERDRTQLKVGLEIDTLEVRFLSDGNFLMLGVPLVQAAANGALDGATIKLERAFMLTWGDTSAGTVRLFEGEVAGVEPTRYSVRVTVESDLAKLNVQMPGIVTKPACGYVLFSAGCGLSRAAYTVSSSVQAGSSTTQLVTGLAQAAGYFELGVLNFTSGPLAGTRRAVKAFSGGVIQLALPLPVEAGTGSTFDLVPGCNRTQLTCKNKFNNLPRFRGYPYVPNPEQAR